MEVDVDHFPAHLRWPSDVIRFFGATRSTPLVGDLVFVPNGKDRFHTLVYMGKFVFQHATIKPDQNGDPRGVVNEFLPQLFGDQNYVLSLERYREYVERHYEGTNINTIE
jgi:hypothetical protein